ncbi:MAG: hypothetical protein KGL67_01775 [Patescibacteria group bacterium]|nr:hypothetical protein [Patescibacteria group bacterium]
MRHVLNLKILSLLIFCLIGANIAHAQSPSIFFSVPSKQVVEGERLTVDVRIQSANQSINAVSGIITFTPNLVNVVSISKDRSIINLWTQEPKVLRNQISFEGVALNPGFQGSNGLVFQINFQAKQAGAVFLNFSEGALLANDGLGTNVLAKLNSSAFNIVAGGGVIPPNNISTIIPESENKLATLPVIIDYSALVNSNGAAYLKGKGEPNALTKIVFKDVSFKSLGEQFIDFLQTKKKKLDEVLVRNDDAGGFQYTSGSNLVAGVYNATPFLVDSNTNTEKPGLGVQLLVTDNKIVKILVVVINVLGLLIPVVGLLVVIYFIPWYSWRRMRVLKRKLGLEEEKLELSEHQLERQDTAATQPFDKFTNPNNPPQ